MLAKGSSALIPRFVLMDPVRVTTGTAKKAQPSAAPAKRIPIPRRRPPMPGDETATIIGLKKLAQLRNDTAYTPLWARAER